VLPVGQIDSAIVSRRATLALVFLLALVGLLAVGCGGEVVSPLPSNHVVVTTAPPKTTLPAAYQNGDATAGKHVFLTAGCTGCHTLKDAGSTGTVGPNLDDAKPPATTVFARVTLGKGQMPSFKSTLSTKQIADVIAYVVKATGGSSTG
jgi:mono/diheme cytochrome c family protein